MLPPWIYPSWDSTPWCHFWQCPWDLGSAWAERAGQGEVGGCTRRAISIFFGINGVRNKRSHLVGPPFPEFNARFSATATKCLLIGGCGQSQEWLKLSQGAVLRRTTQQNINWGTFKSCREWEWLNDFEKKTRVPELMYIQENSTQPASLNHPPKEVSVNSSVERTSLTKYSIYHTVSLPLYVPPYYTHTLSHTELQEALY